MNLAHWRQHQGLTLRETAERLSIAGKNPARSYQRIEMGEALADADMVQRVQAMTHGAVIAEDMHQTRLAYLGRNQAADAA